MHDIAGGELPFQFPRRGVERVNVAVATADEHAIRHDERTRQVDVERIGDRLVLRFEAVQIAGLEAALAAGRELPARQAGARIDRVHFAVVADHVDHRTGDRGCRRHRAARAVFPALGAAAGVDRVDVSIVAADVDDALVVNRRGHDASAGDERPLHAVELARTLLARHAGVRGIAPEHRLRMGVAAGDDERDAECRRNCERQERGPPPSRR